MLPKGPVPVFDSEICIVALVASSCTAPKDNVLGVKVATPLLGAACATNRHCGSALARCTRIPRIAKKEKRPTIRWNIAKPPTKSMNAAGIASRKNQNHITAGSGGLSPRPKPTRRHAPRNLSNSSAYFTTKVKKFGKLCTFPFAGIEPADCGAAHTPALHANNTAATPARIFAEMGEFGMRIQGTPLTLLEEASLYRRGNDAPKSSYRQPLPVKRFFLPSRPATL